MIDEGDCGAIGGMKICRGNRSTRRKLAPAPLCPPQIPHDQTRALTFLYSLFWVILSLYLDPCLLRSIKLHCCTFGIFQTVTYYTETSSADSSYSHTINFLVFDTTATSRNICTFIANPIQKRGTSKYRLQVLEILLEIISNIACSCPQETRKHTITSKHIFKFLHIT
jgi:hypothetical protein